MITEQNFIQHAISAYHNPQCSTIEQFTCDMKKFSGIKRLLNSENYTEDFVNLTLNNIVYLYNIFDNEECTKLLFYKVRSDHWYKLKTYLVFLNRMPERISEIHLINSELTICQNIAKQLRVI